MFYLECHLHKINYSPQPEEFIKHIVKRIENFIEVQLSPRNLHRQTIKFERSYACHEKSHFIFAQVKQWRKRIQHSKNFIHFRNSVIWNMIFKYPTINLATIPPKEQLKALHFWASIMGHMYKEYYEVYTNDHLIEASSLGLFAEIHKTTSYYNANPNAKSFDHLLKPWTDMVDADSIHYALIGKRKSLSKNEPVIVATCDKKSDIERRLECLYVNLQEMSDKGLKINTCPGIIIYFSVIGESIKFDGTIDVQQFIDTLQ